MAYIDENNDVTAGKGKDPVKELDDELELLMQELKEMEQSETAESEPEPQPSPAPRTMENPVRKAPGSTNKPPKKHGKTALIIVLCVVIIGAAAGAWGVYSLLTSKVSDHIVKSDVVETETFSDSVLGDISVKKVDGAALNTYNADKLRKNAAGFYEYVENGEVTSETGIDLAEYQGDVDFKAVKASGVDYVILRIGGRYYSDEGKLYEDGSFDTYYEQAKAAGLKIGAYFFSQAASVEDAVEEAEYAVKKLGGRTLDYPVAFDWEIIDDDEARTDGIGNSTITAMAEAFCDTIEDGGCKSIVYASTSLMLQSYDFETMKDYEFWLADYREFPNMYYDFTMWQYTTDGTVDGIDGAVDLNICFKPYN